MPTIHQPMDEATARDLLRAASHRYWLSRFPPMPADLGAVAFSSTAVGPQPCAIAILAARALAPPQTWLRQILRG